MLLCVPHWHAPHPLDDHGSFFAPVCEQEVDIVPIIHRDKVIFSYSPLPYLVFHNIGKDTPLVGGDPLTSTPALQGSLSTYASTAITPSPMARCCKRSRCRPGHCRRPRAPDPTDGAVPSHPYPQFLIMGGTLPQTATILLAGAIIPTRSASPTPLVTPSNSSLQPFCMKSTNTNYSGGASMIPSAIVATCRRVHDGFSITAVFVGITALVLPIQRDHSADADIGIGHLVPHSRPLCQKPKYCSY